MKIRHLANGSWKEKMHKSLVAILLASSLAACTKEPPMCSDAPTVALVKEIILDKLGVDTAAKEKIGAEFFDRLLTLENMRPSAFDEKIKKFSCEATLVAKSEGAEGSTYRLPVNFESQLDDKDNHIVAVNGLLISDLRQLDLFIAAAIENAKSASAPASPEAGPAVAEQSPQDSLPEAENTPTPEPTNEAADTVEASGVCKGLDLAVTVAQSECVSRKFAIADKKLNDEYKRLMGSLSAERQAELKSSQRAWIKEKEQTCVDAGKEFEGGTLQPIVIADCKVRMTEERNTFLEHYK
jgi:uncharacterized protein YecT (DUF1311 family)